MIKEDCLIVDIQTRQEKFGNKKYLVFVTSTDPESGVKHTSQIGEVEEVGNMFRASYGEPQLPIGYFSKKKTAIDAILDENKA